MSPSSASYLVPAEEIRRVMRVANSRFITSLAAVFTVEEARAFIARMRAEFADASHNVPAYLIGGGDSVVAHCTDDGEPAGTAGRPMLAVLRGSGLGDVAVVVTRYFGGTKLGTGGLVRAYQDAVRQVLADVPRAERRSVYWLGLETPYSLLEQLRRYAQHEQGLILKEDFGEQVSLTIQLNIELLEKFQQGLSELSNGRLQAEILASHQVLVRVES